MSGVVERDDDIKEYFLVRDIIKTYRAYTHMRHSDEQGIAQSLRLYKERTKATRLAEQAITAERDALKKENKVLWKLMEQVSKKAPLSDNTCDEAGITLLEAARRKVKKHTAKEGE